MNPLTFRCLKRVETLSNIEFTLVRTEWAVVTGTDDDMEFEPCHWSARDAQPFEQDETFTFIDNDDEYEVGRHYGFTAEGPLSVPGDDE